MNDIIKIIYISDGVFGAYMQVSIQNNGPVTIEIESPVTLNKTPSNTKVLDS